MAKENSEWVDPSAVEKREMLLLIRNDNRHRELIIYLLGLLKTNNIIIENASSIMEDVQNENKISDNWEEDEGIRQKEMNVLLANILKHRQIREQLLDLLEEYNIEPNDEIKDYLLHIGKYDCMWKDYRKEDEK